MSKLKRIPPKIAITADTTILRCRLLIKLIELAGATPVLIPFKLERALAAKDRNLALEKHLSRVKNLLQECQGVLLPGNSKDIPPKAYKQSKIHPETQRRLPTSPVYARLETEFTMLETALKKKWPLLGVCGGMQVINVFLGGNLIQHLPDTPESKKYKITHADKKIKALSATQKEAWENNFNAHLKKNAPKNIFSKTHPICVKKDSLLGEIYLSQNKNIDLNTIEELSIHHQGCFKENLSKRLKPVAFAPDGVVEAIELKNYPNMFLATQFHPECNVSGIALPLVQCLVQQALKLA